MPHPSPAQHKQKSTSHATVWSITHHTKGANLPWFLNLPLDECIDQHTLTNSNSSKGRTQPSNHNSKTSQPLKTEANGSTQPRRKVKQKAQSRNAQSKLKAETPSKCVKHSRNKKNSP